jgi:hypothetical protein
MELALAPLQKGRMMGAHDSRTAGAGAEFDERLARSDGVSVADVLHENLVTDQTAWLDDRVLPLFEGSLWQQQAANESRCRSEVSLFQAVEAANIAREGGYVADDRSNWFADWMLRLTQSAVAETSTREGPARFWRQGHRKRVNEFGSVLAALLPEPACARNLSPIVAPRRFIWEASRISPACFFIRTLAPLLVFRTHVAVATAFRDDVTAREERKTLDSRDQSLTEAIDEFVTGGVNYVVANKGAWVTSVSEPHGVILPIFTLREAADRACCEGQAVLRVDNREMLARTTEIQRLKVQYVAVITHAASGAEQEARLLPIDQFLQVAEKSVDRSNTGDLARAYRKSVTA